MKFSKEQTASNLKTLRALRNYSQSDLANLSGVSCASIKGYEQGNVVMSLDVAVKIADALGCSVDSLVTELTVA